MPRAFSADQWRWTPSTPRPRRWRRPVRRCPWSRVPRRQPALHRHLRLGPGRPGWRPAPVSSCRLSPCGAARVTARSFRPAWPTPWPHAGGPPDQSLPSGWRSRCVTPWRLLIPGSRPPSHALRASRSRGLRSASSSPSPAGCPQHCPSPCRGRSCNGSRRGHRSRRSSASPGYPRPWRSVRWCSHRPRTNAR